MSNSVNQHSLSQLFQGSIGILGFGVEGKSTFAFLKENGFTDITVFDKNPIDISDSAITVISGDSYLTKLSQCDTIVRSAGINPTQLEIKNFVANGGILTSQVELFFELWQGDIVGVTGTLGKGTCVSMLQEVFEMCGQEYVLGGNIGTPALELLDQMSQNSIAILELSSFQLMTLKKSPRYAIILKTTTEHLDWHKDQDEYVAAKTNLVKYQSEDDFLVFHGESRGAQIIAGSSRAVKKSFGEGSHDAQISQGVLQYKSEFLSIDECVMSGEYNLENAAAVMVLCDKLSVSVEQVKSALMGFKGLKYRLQKVFTLRNGVACYNDSYATRPDATIGAIKNFKTPFTLILGGSEKNADFTELIQTVKNSQSLLAVAVIGQTADRIIEMLYHYSIDKKFQKLESLEQAVAYCLENCNLYLETHKLDGQGEALQVPSVVLSPACASFGLFKNYVHRGDVFNEIVTAYA